MSLIYEKAMGLARIVLNRPEKYNALTPEMFCRLADAWDDAAADPDVRVVLLTAAGDKAFCTGSDLALSVPLKTGARPPENEWDERYLADQSILDRALLRDATFYKPVVVAINGIAIAGGTELLWATDLRVASETATFGLTEVRRGLVPAGGSLVQLPRQVTWCRAMQIALVGETISAQQAAEFGLVNWVVLPSEVRPFAEKIAEQLAVGAPIAQQQIKKAIIRGSGRPIEEALEWEREASRIVRQTEDAREGPRAFVEKRPPRFIGR